MKRREQNWCSHSGSPRLTATLGSVVMFALILLVGQYPQAQTFTPLHIFAGGTGDGANPVSGVTIDTGGYLYVTTVNGGASGYGTITEIEPTGSDSPFSILYSFTGQNDGANPVGRIVFNGSIYGTTSSGKGGDCGGPGGCGVVFKLSPRPSPCSPSPPFCQWDFSTIFTLPGGTGGTDPYGDLYIDSSSHVYGTTRYGGANSSCGTTESGYTTLLGCGIAYKVSPSDKNTWSSVKLYDFGNGATGGKEPYGGVISDGTNLYGNTYEGGQNGYGRIFQLTPGSPWTENRLYDFGNGGSDGRYPLAGLFADNSFNLYGASADGGSGGEGVVFELTNGTWTFSELSPLTGMPGTVNGPRGPLVTDGQGHFYGTEQYGGVNGYGRVFELTCTTSCTYTMLHDFNGSDGAVPYGGLALYSSGGHTYLYGVTYSGGSTQCAINTYSGQDPFGCGVVYQLQLS